MKTISELGGYLLSLPGSPRVLVTEEIFPGEITFHYHRQHRRRFDRKFLEGKLAMGIRIKVKRMSHAKLREECRGETVMFKYIGGSHG